MSCSGAGAAAVADPRPIHRGGGEEGDAVSVWLCRWGSSDGWAKQYLLGAPIEPDREPWRHLVVHGTTDREGGGGALR